MSSAVSVAPEVAALTKSCGGVEEQPPARLSGSMPLGTSTESAGCSSTRRRCDHSAAQSQRPKLAPSTFGASARFAGLNDVQQAAAAHEPLHVTALSVGHTAARIASFSKAPRQSPFPAAIDGRGGGTDDAAPGPGAYYHHERSSDTDVTRRRAPALSMGSAPRSIPIMLLKSGFYVSLSSAEHHRSGATPAPATPRQPSSSPSRAPRQVLPPQASDAIVRRQSPRATMSTARRFLDPSTDVPGPGAYIPISTQPVEGRGKGRCASAPLSRRRDNSPTAAGESDCATAVAADKSSKLRRESSAATKSVCPLTVAVGRPVFCPVDPDVPGPGAYCAAAMDSPLQRTTSRRGSLSFAKRVACDPVVKEEATGASEEKNGTPLLVPAAIASKAAEAAVVGSTFVRRSSNVFLRKSQDHWAQRCLAVPHSGSSRCSSRTGTVSREGSLSLPHGTSTPAAAATANANVAS